MSRRTRRDRQKGPMKFRVWKIQRPLGGAMGQALAYTEGKRALTFLPMSKHLLGLFNGKPKIYAKARHYGETFEIDEVLTEEPGW